MRLALWLTLLLGIACSATAAQSYLFTDVGSLGGTWTYASAISASGRIVGTSALNGDVAHHAFLFDGGGMHDLGTLGGPNSAAYAVNDSGSIVGQSDLLIGSLPHAFTYAGGHMTDLGIVPAGPLAINAAGHVVGSFCLDPNCSTYSHAFLYDGSLHDLGVLSGCPWSHAYGINDQDEIVGESCVPYGSSHEKHAFLYTGGVMTDVNTFAPSNVAGIAQSAYAVNNNGGVVGDDFIYTPGISLIGPLNLGAPVGINNLGQVIGSGGSGAFLYSDGAVTLLSASLPAGWMIDASAINGTGMGINDAGQITGTGRDANGHAHGFLLSPASGPHGPTSTTLPPGSSCSTLAACREALTGALPSVDTAGTKKSQRAARALLRLNGATDHALDQGARSVGKAHRWWYAKARAALARLLTVAGAASDRGTLSVPLAPIEAAVAALRAGLAA